jgi:SSS family solute:Na+ symporter
MNLSYWGFNQYIIQRALGAKSIREAQAGIAFAAYLKLLMPVIVVLPGMAALILAPHLAKPDQAYPTMMRLLPPGLLGLVFAALVAAIIASLASKINSIGTIFTLDIYSHIWKRSDQRRLVLVGRITAVTAVIIGVLMAKPLLGSFDQGFQYIQNFTAYFTPGIVVIFMLGLFWKPATTAGALTAAIGSFALSGAFDLAHYLAPATFPDIPFMNRVSIVFIVCLIAAMGVSLAKPATVREVNTVNLVGVSYKTSWVFNIAGAGVILILIALYKTWW